MIHIILAGDHIGNSLRILTILQGPKQLPISFDNFKIQVDAKLKLCDLEYNQALNIYAKFQNPYRKEWGFQGDDCTMTWLWIDYLCENGCSPNAYNEEHHE